MDYHRLTTYAFKTPACRRCSHGALPQRRRTSGPTRSLSANQVSVYALTTSVTTRCSRGAESQRRRVSSPTSMPAAGRRPHGPRPTTKHHHHQLSSNTPNGRCRGRLQTTGASRVHPCEGIHHEGALMVLEGTTARVWSDSTPNHSLSII
ncbi:hypothetical protein OH77DRAFT_177642 [Trametes cingulata]|nr:hypothetical protein OH77DRAFT_177642 [Trametes cingulata]